MGFSSHETSLNINYSGSCVFQPSSTKAEGYAILIALICVPDSSSVTIHTDLQNSIYNLDYFNNPLISHQKKLNRNNHKLWFFIDALIKYKKINLKVNKVKAHSNDSYNNKADELAKIGLNMAPINLEIPAVDHSLLAPIWNLMGTIKTNQRKWMKKIAQSRIFNLQFVRNGKDFRQIY
jgi:ribonuclease HI